MNEQTLAKAEGQPLFLDELVDVAPGRKGEPMALDLFPSEDDLRLTAPHRHEAHVAWEELNALDPAPGREALDTPAPPVTRPGRTLLVLATALVVGALAVAAATILFN